MTVRFDSRTLLRRAVASGFHRSGLLRVMEKLALSHELRSGSTAHWPRWNRVHYPRFAILCYHRVGMGGVPIFSGLPAAVFEAQMRFLKSTYRVIALAELLQELADPVNHEPAVAVTFDDGYRDLYFEAYPILVKYQVPATIYLTVDAIETGQVAWYDRIFVALQVASGDTFNWIMDRPHRFPITSRAERFSAAVEIITWMRTLPDVLRRESCVALEKRVPMPKAELAERMLTWEQVLNMHLAGVAFGSHSMSHPVISRLSPGELEWELLESKRIMEERLQTTVNDFAYPFGKPSETSPAAESVLARGTYRSAVTTTAGLNVPGVRPYRLLRVPIGEELSLSVFACQLNRLFFRGEYDHSVPVSSALLAPTQRSVESSTSPVRRD